jgi:hypothetical protein
MGTRNSAAPDPFPRCHPMKVTTKKNVFRRRIAPGFGHPCHPLTDIANFQPIPGASSPLLSLREKAAIG